MKSSMIAVLIVALLCVSSCINAQRPPPPPPPPTSPITVVNTTQYTTLRQSNQSVLYNIVLPSNASYSTQPYLISLMGSRFQIGYDYAALLATEMSETYVTFMGSQLGHNSTQIDMMNSFFDYLWFEFYVHHVPERFLIELEGMSAWFEDAGRPPIVPPQNVSRRFFVLANMPADAVNLISGLEHEFERGWPGWLKAIINEIISILEHLKHSCDAFGVWGSRTMGGRLYTSRNLDFASDTGINKYKLVIIFNITNTTTSSSSAPNIEYVTIGFTFGLGALAGMNVAGITTSEMNLDNSRVTFSGLPFPLRLRYVLEDTYDLKSAMTLWNSTNNTNSFNFLIGSAKDGQAYALETMRHYTGVFPANSPIEAAATYNCGGGTTPTPLDKTCKEWTNKTGVVSIGFPLEEAVWRTNHGMNPQIMATQEPLFSDTVFRYNHLHDLFAGFQEAGVLIGDDVAVGIVATLGNQSGENVMSIVYVPGEGRLYCAWEDGSGPTWRQAAQAPYVHIQLK